jgi:hypothetical protein
MSVTIDPRVNAYRGDLADIALSNDIMAERYVEPIMRQCVRGIAPLLDKPNADAHMVSQIRYGEFLDVFEFRSDGYTWVQNRSDRYVGYLPPEIPLSEKIASLSNRVIAFKTFVYPEPDIKSPPIDELTLGSNISTDATSGAFLELTEGGYVFAKHVAPTEHSRTADYVFTAGQLLHTPYLWGGRTVLGLDCSGLVQLVLNMADIDCPRDSDQQREAFGTPLPDHWRDMEWQRGDLVFFPGHVGIMTGSDHMIHASAFDMKTVVEPVFDVVMRGNDILAMGKPQWNV